MMYPKGNQGKRTDINFSQNSEKLTASEANTISRARFILKHDSESAKLVRDGHPDYPLSKTYDAVKKSVEERAKDVSNELKSKELNSFDFNSFDTSDW